jgi:hypothetical protein
MNCQKKKLALNWNLEKTEEIGWYQQQKLISQMVALIKSISALFSIALSTRASRIGLEEQEGFSLIPEEKSCSTL